MNKTVYLNADANTSPKKGINKKIELKPNNSSRLLSIIERSKTNLNNPIVFKRKKSRKKSILYQAFNIDKFVLNKSLDIIDSPWSLKNYTVNKSINTTTENLIYKLKKLFRRQYQLSSSSKLYRKSSKIERETISSNDLLTRNNSTIKSNSNESISVFKPRHKVAIDLKSIYLKKLKNNYYDRKLWDTLANSTSNSVNHYSEQTARQYDSEFNILKRHDWSMSPFAESIISKMV